MLIDPGSKLLMIGDSITDQGRAQPVGEGLNQSLGTGYVNFVSALLNAVYPERRIRVVNMGTSGQQVPDLKARWQTDVIDQKPDWVSIMIGINDVWRQFDLPHQTEQHVALDQYRTTLDELAASVADKKLVMMTPYMIEPNKSDAMRATMDKYSQVVKELAQTHNAIFVDTQAAFDKVLEHFHPMYLAWDRIHPISTGHMIIARAFLKAVNFEF